MLDFKHFVEDVEGGAIGQSSPNQMATLQRQGERRIADPNIPSDQSQTRYSQITIPGQVGAKLTMFLQTLSSDQVQTWDFRKRGAILEKVIAGLGFSDEMEAVRVIQQMRQQVKVGDLTTQASQQAPPAQQAPAQQAPAQQGVPAQTPS